MKLTKRALSQKRTFRFPNRIITDSTLLCSAKKAAAKLYSQKSMNGKFRKSGAQLAQNINCCEKTFYNSVRTLEESNYITITKHYSKSRELSKLIFDRNSYSRTVDVSKNYTKIPTDIFSHDIGFTAFTLYCYLLMTAGNNPKAYPSRKKMIRDLEISKSAIIRATNELVTAGLVYVEQCITKLKCFAANAYYFIQNAVSKLSKCKSFEFVKHTVSANGKILIDDFTVNLKPSIKLISVDTISKRICTCPTL
jgi:predicted transcriptional regulator